MKVPRFPSWVTVPALVILNFIAWLYVYDEYMMGWVIVYPLFMVVAIAFTIAAEMAFGRDRKVKYIGINVCLVLLLLIFAQKYLPMEKVEQGLQTNYQGYLQADAPDMTPLDKGVRIKGFSIIARDYKEDSESRRNEATSLEVYRDGKQVDKIMIADAVAKIQEIAPPEKKADYLGVSYRDVRYVGLKKKGGDMKLVFNKGYVDFTYNLRANENGLIWDLGQYKVGGINLPRMDGLYNDETNKKIKNIILKGNKEQIITVEIIPIIPKENAIQSLKDQGYLIAKEEPLTVEIPFYEICNLGHLNYIKHFSIK